MAEPKRLNEVKSWKEINQKVMKLYKNYFIGGKVINSSSTKQIASTSSSKIIRNHRIKSPLISDCKVNHISLNRETQIIKLPKSPFGKHLTYNDDDEFSDHFPIKSNREYSKKLNLMKRELKSLIKPSKKQLNCRFKANEDMRVYKTPGGELFCKLEIKAIETYKKSSSNTRSPENIIIKTARYFDHL